MAVTFLAALLAALGSCGYAVGARLQHSAVHHTIGDRGFGLRSQVRLVRNNRWLLGLCALGSGAVLHASALGFAPLSVVQPIGVLALPITVLLTAREDGKKITELNPNVTLAVVASTSGVAAFVLLAASSATATEVRPGDQVLATQIVAVAVAALGLAGMLSRSKIRCVIFAAGCASAYGYVSLMMRAVVQKLGVSWLEEISLVQVLGIVAAMLVGAWLLQHAYASGPPDLVVACLTVVDPLVAVGLGIGLLGEADRVSTAIAAAELLCALVACAGVIGLARYHPDTGSEQVHAAASSGGGAGGNPTERPDGSTS